MNRRPVLHLLAAALAAAGVLATPAARADEPWPAARPITLVVPFSAGGSVDFTARLIAPRLAARLGQGVVVENLAGAGGVIGVQKVVNASPDGYTLVAGPDSVIAIGRLINPGAYRFDPLADLAPVGMINTAPMVLVARPGLGVKTWADVVRLAKAAPGRYNYATSGTGSVLHLAMERLKQRSGIFVTHIPYRGGAQVIADMIGNQVDLAMLITASVTPYLREHSLVALGITDRQRLATLPDVPAFEELPGLKGVAMTSWTGLYAPAKTPAAVVERLNQALNAVLKEPDVLARLREQSVSPGGGTADELARFARGEYERNQALVRTIDFKP